MNLVIEENKTLSLGFIGVGWIGRNRMEVLLESGAAQASAIAEPFAENAAEALKLAPEAVFYDSPDQLMQNTELDGVVIATPSALHAKQSLDALKSGKHVFCQKPLGRTSTEVAAIVKASKEADKLLAVDLSYRYTKALEEVYKVVTTGAIGKVFAVDLIFHNAYGPDKAWFYDIRQSGGGCVMDLGVHLIDLALWCLNFPEVSEVRSQLFHKGVSVRPGAEIAEDFATVSMSTADGTAISLQYSWNVSAGRDAVIEAKFYGSEGGVAFKNVNGSFYDFTAEKYNGTQTGILFSGQDSWSGRAGVAWANEVLTGKGFDEESAAEFLQTAQIIDRIYGREA